MFCQIRAPNACGGRDTAAGGAPPARRTSVPPVRALRPAWRMNLRPVRELRVRAAQHCSLVPPLGGSGSGCAECEPCAPEPPKGGTTIHALWTPPQWELHDARHSPFAIRHSPFAIRHSSFNPERRGRFEFEDESQTTPCPLTLPISPSDCFMVSPCSSSPSP